MKISLYFAPSHSFGSALSPDAVFLKKHTGKLLYWSVFPLGFGQGLVRICPNDKFINIFAQRFHYLQDPFYKFFALNLLFQDTSYSLALKYSSFLFTSCSFAFYNINFWFKIIKICPKISHFSQISHSRGNTGTGTS